jgi:hypothetical protein
VGNWLVEQRLKRAGARLRTLRDELRVIDEQLAHLADDADDMGIRSIVSDNTGTAAESRRARETVDAMARHRAYVVEQIAELERRQDTLLDRMVG